MGGRRTAVASAEEYRSLSESGTPQQLIQGELIVSPAPNRYHQEISSNIEFLLRGYLERHPIGKLYDAPFDVYLTDQDVFQPDKAFVSNNRFSILTDYGAKGAPDLVIEILSTATRVVDRDTKKPIYARCGVLELWLVDPDARAVELYRLQENSEAATGIYSGSESFMSACFPGLELRCPDIFKR